jgi:hypothetical protein
MLLSHGFTFSNFFVTVGNSGNEWTLFAAPICKTGDRIAQSGYRLDGQGLIPGRGQRFFSSSHHPDRLWGAPNICPMGTVDKGADQTSIHPLLRSRMAELYLHFLICLHGVVLN